MSKRPEPVPPGYQDGFRLYVVQWQWDLFAAKWGQKWVEYYCLKVEMNR